MALPECFAAAGGFPSKIRRWSATAREKKLQQCGALFCVLKERLD